MLYFMIEEMVVGSKYWRGCLLKYKILGDKD